MKKRWSKPAFFIIAFGLLIFSGIFIFSVENASAQKSDRFGYKIGKEEIFLIAGGNIYLVQPVSIVMGGSNTLYFAAQDFTAKKELLVKKLKETKVLVDKPDRKVIRAVFSLGDDKNTYSEYELELFLETRKEFPFLAVYSKFKYLGGGSDVCAINWGVDSGSDQDPFKYYTIPKGGETVTFPLGETKRTKIGQSNWIFANNGKGQGVGLIAPAVMLGRSKDFIFVNSIPPKKSIAKGESIDVFMIVMPIEKNFKILESLYEKVKNIKWEY